MMGGFGIIVIHIESFFLFFWEKGQSTAALFWYIVVKIEVQSLTKTKSRDSNIILQVR